MQDPNALGPAAESILRAMVPGNGGLCGEVEGEKEGPHQV